MDEVLELHNSDVAAVSFADGAGCIELSQVSIRPMSRGQNHVARIHIEDAQILREPIAYPATIFEGWLHSDYERFDNLVPLPFSKCGRFTIHLVFANGGQLRIVGHNPTIEVLGETQHAGRAGRL